MLQSHARRGISIHWRDPSTDNMCNIIFESVYFPFTFNNLPSNIFTDLNQQ